MISEEIVPMEVLIPKIQEIRGRRVLLAPDLADLYEVETRELNQAVKRNIERFPDDFMFQLSVEEFEEYKRETSSDGKGGRRTEPYAFTEQGIAMLSSVLNSERAIEVNIAIMRAFVEMRRMINSYEELSEKLVELEQKYDEKFKVVFEAIRQLMDDSGPGAGQIGYIKDDESNE